MVDQPDKRILHHFSGSSAVPGHIEREPKDGRIVSPVKHRKRVAITLAKPLQQMAIGAAIQFLHEMYDDIARKNGRTSKILPGLNTHWLFGQFQLQ